MMEVIERKLWEQNIRFVAGIDEVGRGPLAGPVVAASVVLPYGKIFEGIDDSKKLSPDKREEMFHLIIENAVSIGIGYVDSMVIDKVNILRATLEAMKRAICNMNIVPDYLLIDGTYKLDGVPIFQNTVVKGDSKSQCIAAASIVAKVYRDRLMEGYDIEYPMYNFSKNKGYGTREHIEALMKYGPCKIHRFSFAPVKNSLCNE
ncbi:MAG TPA: ribonuclease HII [Firmicutes bacterium]|jgi:ribonuclease HII|uniref:Ribonuclease HII n=1 Tax=candidate division TA06 bacterium TaxID=2250710 RepID=A0A660S7Z8_UNCT6|nr:MAG: ribonuclease HII [candidate division TA06 bacterium]HFD05097.1 ribonuclease HII [Bacillota bacterium]